MDKTPARKTFMKLLVTALISVVVIVVCYLLGSTNTFTAILTSIILLVNAFVLLFHWVTSITELFKHTTDKKRKENDYFYFINMFFSTIILVFFMVFYFQLLGGAFIELVF